MSNWTDDIDGFLGDPSQDNATIKVLREKIKADGEALKTMREEVATLRSHQRATLVADELKSAGVRPEVAKFYTGDADPAAVKAWVEENAPLFGAPQQVAQEVTAQEAAPQAAPVFTPDSQAAYQRMMSAGVDGVPGSNFNDAMGALANATSLDELMAAMRQHS